MKIGEVVNPPKTQPSGTFTLSVFDSLGGLIETVDQGLYFLTLPGQFSKVAVTADDYMINEKDVTYAFEIIPDDSFTSEAIMRLTIPDQISADSITLTSTAVMSKDAKVDLQFGKYIYITNGFPSGYNAGSNLFVSPIKFSFKGFTNPPTISPSESFELSIYYVENKNEVSKYTGNALSITAIPSPMISLTVDLSSDEANGSTTGFINT